MASADQQAGTASQIERCPVRYVTADWHDIGREELILSLHQQTWTGSRGLKQAIEFPRDRYSSFASCHSMTPLDQPRGVTI
jgi:hypothetical protein